MDLINQKVEHKLFGEGTILTQAQDAVTVQFAGQQPKLFEYPEAFAQFLTLQDSTLQKEAAVALRRKVQRIGREKERARRQHEALLAEEAEAEKKEKAAKPARKKKA